MKSLWRLSVAVVVLASSRLLAGSPAQPAVGALSREQVEAIVADWGSDVSVDNAWSARVEDIKHVQNGATIRVFMGTWCDDSKEEIPQFMKILNKLDGHAPFSVEFFAVDEQKQQPSRELEANVVWYLPTFIVLRNGREVGRIVEQPARTLEKDLLRLLNGTARGLLSSNENAIMRYLSGEPSPPPR